jgi:hypothetical protein
VTAPRSPNVLRTVWWIVSGKLHRAKRLLAGMVGGDLAGVNGIGIAAHNIVNSLIQMKRLYSDLSSRRTLSAEEAVRQSLSTPVSLLRQATSNGGDWRLPVLQEFFIRAGNWKSQQSSGRTIAGLYE